MPENGCLAICTDRELLYHAIERMVEGSYLCTLVHPEDLNPQGAGVRGLKLENPTLWLNRYPAGSLNCIVLDSETQGADLMHGARARLPGLPVIVWQRANATEASLHALELGALGVLHDSSTAADVAACLKSVHGGHVWVPQAVAQAALDFRRYRLSRREWQVMKLVSQGMCNKEIAYAMGITEGTTKVYLSRMFDKLEVADRYELALLGLRHFAQTAAHGVNEKDFGRNGQKPDPQAAGRIEGDRRQSVFVYRPPSRTGPGFVARAS